MRHLDKYGNPISSGNFYGGYSRSASMSATRKTYNAPNSRMGLSRPPVIIGRKSPSGKTVVTKSRSGGRRVVKSRSRSYTPRQTMIFSDKKGYRLFKYRYCNISNQKSFFFNISSHGNDLCFVRKDDTFTPSKWS